MFGNKISRIVKKPILPSRANVLEKISIVEVNATSFFHSRTLLEIFWILIENASDFFAKLVEFSSELPFRCPDEHFEEILYQGKNCNPFFHRFWNFCDRISEFSKTLSVGFPKLLSVSPQKFFEDTSIFSFTEWTSVSPKILQPNYAFSNSVLTGYQVCVLRVLRMILRKIQFPETFTVPLHLCIYEQQKLWF